jgi:hypothetical protein
MPTTTQPRSLVLVIGAGASKEASLPVGGELKRQIADALDIRFDRRGRRLGGDDLIAEAYNIFAATSAGRYGDINPLLRASWRIRDAMPQAISIDSFIDTHRSDELIAVCGKLAIARCILAAESNSSLKVDTSNIYNKMNFGRLEGTWYNAFFQLLTESCPKQDLPSRFAAVAIICFNYDRCIEHYLHSALQNYYALTPVEATNALEDLEIYHPYGTVGALPWQDPGGGFEFGASPRAKQLVAFAEQIRTFSEGTDPDESDVSAIRESLSMAERIAFLGFAFHRLNLELLFPTELPSTEARGRSVYATAVGISKADADVISRDLSRLGAIDDDGVHIRIDLTCVQLFREYWRSLSIR